MEQRVSIERMEEAINLFGSFDENIRLLEAEFHVTVVNRDGELRISGEPEEVMMAAKAVEALLTLSGKGESITEQHVRYVIGLCRSGQSERIGEPDAGLICITSKAARQAQDHWSEAVCAGGAPQPRHHRGGARRHRQDVSGGGGGRGRLPSQAGQPHHPDPPRRGGRRAAGLLPGDLQSKVDPYLRPLYDALFDMLGAETYQKYLERGNIEVAPLAYMRGRTLDDSFIILDEAQNTSREQMKMFLTRMGSAPKMVITGDITQIDLPGDKPSGLKDAMKILKGVEGVSICQLTQQDVVRHVMVQRIIEPTPDSRRSANEKDTLHPHHRRCTRRRQRCQLRLIRRAIRTALAAEGLTAPCEVDVLSGRYVIDAKSIMGLFSLDLSHPVKVEVHGSDADRSAFEQSVAAFEVKQTQ